MDGQYVQVTVQHGIVVLRGQVSNLASAARAAEAARLVRGVRAVVSYLQPADAPIAESRLVTEVLAALRRSPPLDPALLQVRADSSRVTLQGVVRSLAQKRAALAAAWSVYGVTGVHDRLRVVPAVSRTDAEIADEVTALLRADGYAPSAVRVEVRNGIVTLSGEVKGLFDKRRTLERAAVEGAVGVRNALLVQQERDERERPYLKSHSSTATLAAIKDAYALDPRVPEESIQVHVRAGVVELKGSVATEAQKLAAAQDARYTVGVEEVENELTLSGTRATDAKLRQELEARLAGHAYVEGSDIDVNVERGQVVLDGKVIGSFQSRAAERTARLTPGVVGVENRLQLEKTSDNFRGDDGIERDVEAELEADPLVDRSKLTLSVENGVVTVSGVVENWEVYNSVLEHVFGALPVGVVNQLETRKPPELLYSR